MSSRPNVCRLDLPQFERWRGKFYLIKLRGASSHSPRFRHVLVPISGGTIGLFTVIERLFSKREGRVYVRTWQIVESLLVTSLATVLMLPSLPAQAKSTILLPLPLRLSIARDMGAGEARPTDVSEENIWAKKARVNLGNKPGSFKSILPWSQIFAGPGNTASVISVQIRNFRALILYKYDTDWTLAKASQCVSGAYFSISYTNNQHSSNDIRDTLSKTCSVAARPGSALHFWPSAGRTPLKPREIVGVIVMAEARIAPKDSTITGAHYLMSVGADYWQNQTAEWNNYKTNGDAGIGRFKWITPKWRMFSMTTLSPIEIINAPAAIGSYGE